MIKIINILSQVLNEQKRYQFSPDVYQQINSVVDKLWNDRKKDYGRRKELVDIIQFKTADGVDGLVKIIVNPRLPYVGFQGIRPKYSTDPADLFIEVNPKKYESKKNLYLTIYHEMIHASDPTQSHKWSSKYEMTYDPEKDEKYWGHPIEFFAITNEFLEGLILEFKRRRKKSKNPNNIKLLEKSFQNILNYFARGEKLSRLSLDILFRINDEYVNENKISEMLADIKSEYPNVSELLPQRADTPYFLHLIELIKKFNPEIWPRFLTMIYKVKEEITEILK